MRGRGEKVLKGGGGGSRHAGWLAGWSEAVLLGWCMQQAFDYILGFLLPQPVRLRALSETCVSGQL